VIVRDPGARLRPHPFFSSRKVVFLLAHFIYRNDRLSLNKENR